MGCLFSWQFLSSRFPKARILGHRDLPDVHKAYSCYDVAKDLNGEKSSQSLKTLPQIRGRPSPGRNIMPQIQGMISWSRNIFPQNGSIFLRGQKKYPSDPRHVSSRLECLPSKLGHVSPRSECLPSKPGHISPGSECLPSKPGRISPMSECLPSDLRLHLRNNKINRILFCISLDLDNFLTLKNAY